MTDMTISRSSSTPPNIASGDRRNRCHVSAAGRRSFSTPACGDPNAVYDSRSVLLALHRAAGVGACDVAAQHYEGSILAVVLFHGILDIVIIFPGTAAIVQNAMGALLTTGVSVSARQTGVQDDSLIICRQVRMSSSLRR